MAKTELVFKVQRCEPELIRPAKPTPHEFKRLSDIDDQEGLRFQIPVIQFYRHVPAMHGKDPVQAVRDGLSRALVYYYPFAGRLREAEGKKLVVECTGEGVLFIEADLDLRLEEFGDSIQPPFPCLEELLYDVPGSGGVLDSPLMLIQVTRLKCGGFTFAVRLNHTMSDASGLTQFMSAVAEMGRGATSPSVLPVWQRELLDARNPPRITCTHREYDEVDDSEGTILPLNDIVQRSFFFGRDEVTAIRKSLPRHLQSCSRFELLTASLWRCRTTALQPEPEDEMRVICTVNTRSKFSTPLPEGYYGNVFMFPVALATAAKLCGNPLGYAVELVRKAKADVTEEYVRSVADLMVIKGRPHFKAVRSYLVSDIVRAGFGDVDFGWGKPVYGGAAKGGVGPVPGLASFYIPFRNHKGEDGIVVPICLPGPAMERFVEALDSILKGREAADAPKSAFVLSAL